MTDKEVRSTYTKVCDLIYDKRLKPAFDQLTILLALIQKGDWMDQKTDLEQNYQYMLQYAVNGISDPQQQIVYNRLRTDMLQLADKVENAYLTTYSSEYPYRQKRQFLQKKFPDDESIKKNLIQFHANSIVDNLLKESNVFVNSDGQNDYAASHDTTLSLVFNRLWLKACYSEYEETMLDMLIDNANVIAEDQCVLVSAITLGLLLMFDEKKFSLLISITTKSKGSIRIRGLIGLVINICLYNRRIQLYPNLISEITNLTKTPNFNSDLMSVILQFITCLETEKISKELREEIMPEMMKESPFVKDKMDLNELMDDSSKPFKQNPDWDEKMDKWNFSDKVQRFAELQKNGADVFLNTFSSMKNHAFFNDICNWFVPFSTSNSYIRNAVGGQSGIQQLMDLITLNPLLCNSDRYSLVFGLMSMPENYRKMMEDGLKMQDEQIKEIKEEASKIGQSDSAENNRILSQQYWQDLYRFFKLHRERKDFFDPFNVTFKLYNLYFISELDDADKMYRTFAEFYLKKNYYHDAEVLFLRLYDKSRNNLDLLQKLGFCYQQQNEYEEALKYYEEAELLQSDNLWMMRMMANCHIRLKHYDKALMYFQILSTRHPDDMHLLLCIGQCYIGLKQYVDASQLFFKVEYLAPNNPKVWRSISWCAFMQNKMEQASVYLLKIDQKDLTAQDNINLGHIQWCCKRLKDSIFYYKKACILLNGDVDKLMNIIEADLPFLISNGINKSQIPIVLDMIRYEV